MERRTPIKTAPKKPQTPLQRSLKAAQDAEPQQSDFSNTDLPPNSARIMRITEKALTSFNGLKSFPNLRVLDLRPSQFSLRAILVAFRSFYLTEVNGEKVKLSDVEDSSRYSGLVTLALRCGFDPNLSDDAESSLKDALNFLSRGQPSDMFSTGEKDTEVTVLPKGDVYSWCILDDSFTWRNITSNTATISTSRNSPLRCVIKGIRNETVFVPEHDSAFHVYAELTGEAIEGGIISVRAPLSSLITWRCFEDESVLSEGSLVLPLSSKDVNNIIACDIAPAPGLPTTRLITDPVKPGEFRFKSLRMQGQMIEDDEIEFDVSTRGTKATFKGVRILRSARHGEWENVTTIENGKLSYKLTVYDIGCVIRAVCLTEGGGPPLMLTSSERVQPSAPSFSNPLISGQGCVGAPLFAIASYKGGIQGNCRYEWNVGKPTDRNRPVVIPIQEDVGKQVKCRMIPIRSDGSIGKAVEAVYPAIRESEDQNVLQERFLQFKKVTKNGRLQMSFVESCPQQLFSIPEGKTIIVSTPVDWAVVASDEIHNMDHSKTFTATSEFIKGFVVLFTDEYFVLVGQIEAASPTASNVVVQYESQSSMVSTSYTYTGGIEGRTIVQWNRIDRNGETVVSFGKTYHIGISDRNVSFKAIITPFSIDGKKGSPVSSQPYFIHAKDVVNEEEIPFQLIAPQDIYEGQLLVIAPIDEKIPKNALRISASVSLTKRERVLWENGNKLLAEGIAFTPSISDIGETITIRVVDRVREKDLANISLPSILSLPPSVKDLKLVVQDGNTNNGRPTKSLSISYKEYKGGIEGKSTIVWKAQKPGAQEFIEIVHTTRHWIEVDHVQFSSWIFIATLTPTNISGESGQPIDSNPVIIPEAPRQKIIDIKKAVISADEKYENFICSVVTDDQPGTLEYLWGYIVDGEEQYTEENQATREITPDDFDYPPFCRVQPIGVNGEKGEKALVYLSVPTKDLFTPIIQNVTIKTQGKDNKLLTGSSLTANIDYTGPPAIDSHITWERNVNKQWIQISTKPIYVSNGNDIGHQIRVRVSMIGNAQVLEEPVPTPEFVSQPIVVQPNQTIVKLATALRRSKAIFNAKLSIGDEVTVTLCDGQFIMKSKNNVLLKDQITLVHATIDDESDNLVEISAHHGYNTQLVFDNMKMKGGTKFDPFMTRELFVETLKRFQQ